MRSLTFVAAGPSNGATARSRPSPGQTRRWPAPSRPAAATAAAPGALQDRPWDYAADQALHDPALKPLALRASA